MSGTRGFKSIKTMITKFLAHAAFDFLYAFESCIRDEHESEQIIVVLDILRKYM